MNIAGTIFTSKTRDNGETKMAALSSCFTSAFYTENSRKCLGCNTKKATKYVFFLKQMQGVINYVLQKKVLIIVFFIVFAKQVKPSIDRMPIGPPLTFRNKNLILKISTNIGNSKQKCVFLRSFMAIN